MHRLAISCILIFFLNAALHAGNVVAAVDFERVEVEIEGDRYLLEIAKTPSQRAQGLMHRESLGLHEGMLFIYPIPGFYRIWMKNTRVPLQVLWLDENQTVIDVKILRPCHVDPCPKYKVARLAKYIIELNVDTRGIEPGDRIEALRRFE